MKTHLSIHAIKCTSIQTLSYCTLLIIKVSIYLFKVNKEIKYSYFPINTDIDADILSMMKAASHDLIV